MRKPTPYARSHAWHTATLAGLKPPITHEPQCGWFMRRLGKDAPPVPAIIYLEGPIDPATGDLLGPETMICEINGQRRNPVDEWTWLAGRPISEQQYLDMMGDQLGDVPESKSVAAERADHLEVPSQEGPGQTAVAPPVATDPVPAGLTHPDPFEKKAAEVFNSIPAKKPPGAKTIF